MSKFTKKSMLILAAVLLVAGTQVKADDPLTEKLLKDYWSKSKGRTTTSFFAAEKERSPESVYAFALVKTYQNDVKMALRAIEVLEKMDAENPRTSSHRPIRLKVWLLLRQDRFDDATVALMKYVRETRKNPEVTDFEMRSVMMFAGKIVGFLDGPVANKVNQQNRDAAITMILEPADQQLRQAFDAGYTEVAQKYNGLMSQKQNVDAEAAEQDAKIQQAKYEALAAREKELAMTEQRVAAERANTRAAINKGLTDIARRDLTYSNPATYYSPSFIRTYRPVVVHSYGSHSSSMGSSAPRHHYATYRVGRPVLVRSGYSDLQARREVLAGHYAQLRDLGAGQMNALNRELKDVHNARQRTMNQKLRALKPSGKIVTRSVALKTKARSIMTYEAFPLEIERDILLAEVR